MTITTTTLDTADNNFVLGETLRPLLTHAMGSAVEVFDTSGPAGAAHVPSSAVHSYRNVTDVHFLTITTQGDAAAFFSEVANEVEMNPPDIAGVLRVAASHDIEFVM
jgi:hypothetical protein